MLINRGRDPLLLVNTALRGAPGRCHRLCAPMGSAGGMRPGVCTAPDALKGAGSAAVNLGDTGGEPCCALTPLPHLPSEQGCDHTGGLLSLDESCIRSTTVKLHADPDVNALTAVRAALFFLSFSLFSVHLCKAAKMPWHFGLPETPLCFRSPKTPLHLGSPKNTLCV